MKTFHPDNSPLDAYEMSHVFKMSLHRIKIRIDRHIMEKFLQLITMELDKSVIQEPKMTIIT